ncbi:hypothetical protein NVV99_25615, partial [Rhodococcus sp. PAE-6]|uniref:hypothetical protein n=1 Tax=Rhodococcus sp. PAE-6 TaxID=2972477 RepID=UPI0021B29CBD
HVFDHEVGGTDIETGIATDIPLGSLNTAFQTGAQLVLTHDAIEFSGGTGAAMLALGAIPFAAAAILVSANGIPRFIDTRARNQPA